MEQSAPMLILHPVRRRGPRARTQSPQSSLEFVGPGVMRWEDVRATRRERVRDLLAALLGQAARRAGPAEGGDDE